MTSATDTSPASIDEGLALLQIIIGRKSALTVIDLLATDSVMRYGGFVPVGEMLVGLRFQRNEPARNAVKPGRSLAIVEGQISVQPQHSLMFTPPRVPHRTEHVHGFWHINDEQELAVNLKLSEQQSVTVLIEGFPQRGRKDRFAWFCPSCLNPLYLREVDTGRLGLPGAYAAQEDAFEVFNNDAHLRTCKRCGTQHPLAYSSFNWCDSPEQKAAREAG
ncbi:MAG: hypothetical protein JWP52_2172 [Rhizobacter sp.]|nr:hypothetical protein [Rhizobacter sp.]